MAVDFQYLFQQWDALGLYDTLLPFLLIFAVIFGILTATNILGDNRGVSTVIALVLALLALGPGREYIFTDFLRIIAPKFAILMTILLLALIGIGIFLPRDSRANGWFIGLAIFAILAVIVVVVQSFDEAGLGSSGFWTDNWPSVLLVIGVIVMIVVIVVPKIGGDSKQLDFGKFRISEK
jgi:hypothetical protein